jgi:hypothetical protein
MTDLLNRFRQYGSSVLASTPEIAHQWTEKSDICELSIPASSSNGFDIERLRYSCLGIDGYCHARVGQMAYAVRAGH